MTDLFIVFELAITDIENDPMFYADAVEESFRPNQFLGIASATECNALSHQITARQGGEEEPEITHSELHVSPGYFYDLINQSRPARDIQSHFQITSFFYCKKCMESIPGDVSPEAWARLSIGITKLGLQVWCDRHNRNVLHMDLEGIQYLANIMSG